MKKFFRRISASLVSLSLAILVVPAPALGDTIILKNGDRVTGQVNRLRSGRIEVSTSWAGTVRVDTSAIASVETDDDVTIVLKDYSRLVGRLVKSPDSPIAVQTGTEAQPVAVTPGRVSALLRGSYSEEDWRITGRINAGVTDTFGNTDVRRMNLDGETIARKNFDRWSFAARGSQATDRGQETEANATVSLKYDRFITERAYAYAGSTLEHDRFKDLRLRATLGVGAGYQVLESSTTNLSFEGGVDRVRTDFFEETDQLTYAARLSTRFDAWLLENWLQVFHNNQIYLGLQDFAQSFARTQTGLRLPLQSGLYLALQYNIDWDGNPAPDLQSLDRTLIFNVGYKW